jgi:hypothetical protein
MLLPDGEEWEVEKILDERKHYRKTQYLVKWLGYPEYENSWVKESDLENCKELLEEFRNRRRPAVVPPSVPKSGKRRGRPRKH